MTDDENRKLAEWMGWHENKKVNWWCDINDNGIFGSQRPFYFGCEFCELWHPRESLEQAMMLLEKLKEWELFKWDNIYKCCVGVIDHEPYVHTGGWRTTPAAAIVEAVLKVIEE